MGSASGQRMDDISIERIAIPVGIALLSLLHCL
jgi:hypothetical protein